MPLTLSNRIILLFFFCFVFFTFFNNLLLIYLFRAVFATNSPWNNMHENVMNTYNLDMNAEEI